MEIYKLKDKIDSEKNELDEIYRNLCIPEYRQPDKISLCKQKTSKLRFLLNEFEICLERVV